VVGLELTFSVGPKSLFLYGRPSRRYFSDRSTNHSGLLFSCHTSFGNHLRKTLGACGLQNDDARICRIEFFANLFALCLRHHDGIEDQVFELRTGLRYRSVPWNFVAIATLEYEVRHDELVILLRVDLLPDVANRHLQAHNAI